MEPLTPDLAVALVHRLALSVFVFRRQRLVYRNSAAETMCDRIQERYGIDLEVMLRGHLAQVFGEGASAPALAGAPPIVTLLTAPNGEPFYVHVMRFGGRDPEVAITVRAIGAEFGAFRQRYRLSGREAQVAALVVHGYGNSEIGAALGIATATAKKHLTRIFDKVGVNSRSQLQTRLS